MKGRRPLVDVNVSWGVWPFHGGNAQRLPSLVRHLTALGIRAALVSPVPAILAPDPQWDNDRLLRLSRGRKEILPCVVIHPLLANWRDSLKASCDAGARGVKLFPSYHGYSLDLPAVDELIDRCTRLHIVVALSMRIEDERSHHPLMQVPPPSLDEIVRLARRHPGHRFLILCPYLHEVSRLAEETDNTLVELSHIESLDTVRTLLDILPATRVLFGSHTPFLYTKAAMAKIEDCPLSCHALDLIAWKNASRLLGLSIP